MKVTVPTLWNKEWQAVWNSLWCLYRCYDYAGVLLYIGATSQWPQRMCQHQYNSFWWFEVRIVRIKPHPGLPWQVEYDEHQAIMAEKPLYNLYGRAPRDEWDAREYRNYILALERHGVDSSNRWEHDSAILEMRDKFTDEEILSAYGPHVPQLKRPG